MARYQAAGMLLACAILTAGSVSWEGTHAQGQPRVDVLIAFQTTPGASEQALVRAFGGEIRFSYHIVPAIAASLPEAAVAALAANPRVARIEPDGLVYALDHDAELTNTWGVKRIGAGDIQHGGHAGAGVRVAIVDSGIHCGHSELVCAGGYDFVNNTVLGASSNSDDNGHGTHVAGTVAAARDGVGVVGVAPQVELYALKVLTASGSGSFSSVIAAVQWAADRNIHITNNSYGSGTNPGAIVQAAFDNTAGAILHIGAAGNSGNCGGKGDSVGYPAKYASVVAVAATNSSDGRPCFSSTGAAVEIAAPGVSINSTKTGGGYAVYSGTSMASPHVAGVAALVKATDTTLSAESVRAILTGTADDLGAAGRDPQYGWGLVNAVGAVRAADGDGDGGSGGGTEPPPPPPPPPGDPSWTAEVAYATSGGRNGKKDLVITVTLRNSGSPSASTPISIQLYRDGSVYGTASGTTGTNGVVTFKANNAPSGLYSTAVTNPAGTITVDPTYQK